MLFSSAVQPPIISLFSSTSSEPLSLFSSSTDQALPSDSFVHLLHDRYSAPLPDAPKALLHLPPINDNRESDEAPHRGVELDQTVLHIQSPTIRTTYVQSPPMFPPYGDMSTGDRSASALGIKHPWMHVQVRNLGREWSFEVGVVDQTGRAGTIRFATFQVKHFFVILYREYEPSENSLKFVGATGTYGNCGVASQTYFFFFKLCLDEDLTPLA